MIGRIDALSGWSRGAVVGLALVAAAWTPATGAAAAEEETAWSWLRGELFGERAIEDGRDWLRLEAPTRAHDAAVVPIDIVALAPQAPDRFIRSITLIIDENPAPVAATFRFGPASPSATISTRVRVNAYTDVRAVAETGDGRLLMVKRFVKASGGCSAPALKDQDTALAHLGEMRLRQFRRDVGGPAEAQLSIRHPNYSGLQMNQLTRHYIPAEFVREIEVRQGEALVLAMEGGISLSENPTLRFRYRADGADTLRVRARDTEEREFTGSWPLAAEERSKG